MAKFEWSNDLSVKVGTFDNEHKRLIAMINKLHEAMAQGQARNIVPSLLDELVNYTKTHFKNEESYMVKFSYPAYKNHKKYHDEFIAKINEMINDFNKGNLTLSISIGNFLSSWITTHIQKVDMSYSEFMNKNGLN